MRVDGMLGLGDNIYQRAFIKALPKPVLLSTPWPQLYDGIDGVEFIKPQTSLRTQKKNVDAQKSYLWKNNSRHHSGKPLKVRYGPEGIVKGMRSSTGIEPSRMDLPDFGPSPVEGRYVVIRPMTLRTEWLAQSRNGLAKYINEAVAFFRAKGFTVVALADVDGEREWFDGELPDFDVEYLRGELNLTQSMALIRHSSALVGGVGWIIPAAIAYGKPAWIILGGNGALNSPENLLDDSQDCSQIGFAVPDRFCRCKDRYHNCNKTITNHKQQLEEWADGVRI